MGFSGADTAQAGTDLWPEQRFFHIAARLFGLPAALTGMALSFYTAPLMSAAVSRTDRRTSVAKAFSSKAGEVERFGAIGLGLVVPLGLLAASRLLDGRPRRATTLASLATLAGSFLLRTAMLGVGDESANRPDVSFRFSTPRNL